MSEEASKGNADDKAGAGDKPSSKDVELDKGTMTFWEHLDELRSRLVKAALAVIVGGVAAWYFKETILALMLEPFITAWAAAKLPGEPIVHFPTPAALFIAYLKLSLLAGLLLAAPVVFYQLWSFIAPGLYSREKRLALPFVFVSTGLFAGGAYFGWRLALPMALEYLLGFAAPGATEGLPKIDPTMMVGEYLTFVTRLFLAFGLTFELPVLVTFLALAGIVNHKQLLKFSRYFVVLSFVIAAIITPPDAMSQLMLAVPLCVLYFVSIGIAWLVQKKPVASEVVPGK